MTDYTLRKELLLKGIEDGSFPRLLYKYRDPSQNTESIFSSLSMWFSSPSSFNDPFDCNLSEVETHSVADARQFLEHILDGRPDKELLSSPDPDVSKLKAIMERAKAQTLDNTGILCLSKNFDSILMWSHYTNSHKGLVIEFDIKNDPDFFLSPVNVKYATDYSPTNYFTNQHDAITRIISTKSDSWKYEAEVRIIKHNVKGLIAFNPNSIRRVIFGCRADPDLIDKVRSLCSTPELEHVQFAQMRIAHSKFALQLEALAI